VLDAVKIQQWCQKILHGRYLYELNQEYIDRSGSHALLTQSDIFPEAEGFVCAIMDQVITTTIENIFLKTTHHRGTFATRIDCL
jgi:hypothetical protein